jgi:Ala-tRNA(Pro) deacylase
MNVQDFLSRQAVPFDVISHSPTFDAQHLAHEVHVSGHEVAKTVLLRAHGGQDYFVAVLPASKKIDLVKAKAVIGSDDVELASEAEIKQQCNDCEVGALPPFGTSYGMKTFVDSSLTKDESIVFEGNRHDEAIKMKFEDYRNIEQPQVAEFTCV